MTRDEIAAELEADGYTRIMVTWHPPPHPPPRPLDEITREWKDAGHEIALPSARRALSGDEAKETIDQ